jgi:hypothetical protein
MAFGKKRTATFYDKEILKYWTGGEVTANIVIDGTTVPQGGDGRYILEAGTVMSKIAASTKVKPSAASGLLEADVVGILTHTLEFFYPPEANVTDEPAAVYFAHAHFDVAKLVNYASNSAAVNAALNQCMFHA